MSQTARVIGEHKTQYKIRDDSREYTATVRGKFLAGSNDLPKVGDFVEYTETAQDQAVIEKVLPRKTVISRTEADRARESAVVKFQILVTNVDYIFVVMGLDGDFNLRRLERYVILAERSKVIPVIVLNKKDTINEVGEYINQVKDIAPHVPVHAVSALSGENLSDLLDYIQKDTTVVLLGSSGAGKSTITNWLLGEERQLTKSSREDDSRGRHTTTRRELFHLPRGGYLIDTPGIRELGGFTAGSDDVFADIEALSQECMYSDCDHDKSEGCAIKCAIEEGRLDEKRVAHYVKLKREKEYLRTKVSEDAYIEHRQKVRKIHKERAKILQKKYKDRGFK